ncbi:hypothetical protein FS837_004146 [Tulasnella sp. UAMH 9824]|nr:hypothetical protein FS837_004146 [Tulasnella sp. UAMH 9824]
MTGSTSRYYMHIHNLMQQRALTMLEATFPEGPRHQEVWTSTITSGSMFTWGRRADVIDNRVSLYPLSTVTSSSTGLGLGPHTAQANSKQAARDAASLQAIIAMGIDLNTLRN